MSTMFLQTTKTKYSEANLMVKSPNSHKYQTDNLSNIHLTSNIQYNIIKPIILPRLTKSYTDDEVKVTSGLGKYLDKPNPDFWNAYYYLEEKQKTLSEDLYFSIRMRNNVKYDYSDLKKEFISDIKSLTDKFIFMAKGLSEDVNKETYNIRNSISNMRSEVARSNKQTLEAQDKCFDLSERFNLLEENLGVTVYKRRLQEKQELNPVLSKKSVKNK